MADAVAFAINVTDVPELTIPDDDVPSNTTAKPAGTTSTKKSFPLGSLPSLPPTTPSLNTTAIFSNVSEAHALKYVYILPMFNVQLLPLFVILYFTDLSNQLAGAHCQSESSELAEVIKPM